MSVSDSALSDGTNVVEAQIVTPIDVPGHGMQFFGIMIMLLAVLVFPLAWLMMHGDGGGSGAVGALLPLAFLTWNIMFLSGAVFYGCGKIVTLIWKVSRP